MTLRTIIAASPVFCPDHVDHGPSRLHPNSKTITVSRDFPFTMLTRNEFVALIAGDQQVKRGQLLDIDVRNVPSTQVLAESAINPGLVSPENDDHVQFAAISGKATGEVVHTLAASELPSISAIREASSRGKLQIVVMQLLGQAQFELSQLVRRVRTSARGLVNNKESTVYGDLFATSEAG